MSNEQDNKQLELLKAALAVAETFVRARDDGDNYDDDIDAMARKVLRMAKKLGVIDETSLPWL